MPLVMQIIERAILNGVATKESRSAHGDAGGLRQSANLLKNHL